MFGPVTIPFGSKMLFNTVKLKPGVTMDDVELAIGEMCNVVKDTYGGDKGGFFGGQVFRFSGFASPEGSLGGVKPADAHLAIVTYWRSFEEHERSHADKTSRKSSPRWPPCAARARSSATTCSGRARPRRSGRSSGGRRSPAQQASGVCLWAPAVSTSARPGETSSLRAQHLLVGDADRYSFIRIVWSLSAAGRSRRTGWSRHRIVLRVHERAGDLGLVVDLVAAPSDTGP